MVKLSELASDTLLCVSHRYDAEISLMSKEEFLDSAYSLDYPTDPFPSVTLAMKEIKSFDLWDTIERIGEDDTYEGWDLDVWVDLKDLPETVAFMQRVKEVFEGRPIYWEGKPVEIDMFPQETTPGGRNDGA